MSGSLYVVATPIGNLSDVTERAKEILSEVDEWVVEDSRRAAKLRDGLGLSSKPMNRYYDENETRQTPELIKKLESGLDLALLCDAGTPLISDPGFELVREARQRELEVLPVPGVSAVTAALSVSGFPSSEFLFIGYFPRTREKRREKLLEIQHFPGTVVFFEAPHRIDECLKAVRTHLGDRRLFVGREMTKQHEDYWTGTADGLLGRLNEETEKGEFTVLVHPGEGEDVDAEEYLGDLLRRGMKLSDAARVAATYSKRTRSELYKVGLDLQDDIESDD
jgi:16S rRNA (cytidine1402-2'-O)-methyltransferase